MSKAMSMFLTKLLPRRSACAPCLLRAHQSGRSDHGAAVCGNKIEHMNTTMRHMSAFNGGLYNPGHSKPGHGKRKPSPSHEMMSKKEVTPETEKYMKGEVSKNVCS